MSHSIFELVQDRFAAAASGLDGRKPLWALTLSVVVAISGCATKPRELLPTPLLYQGGQDRPELFEQPEDQSTSVDLLYISDRGPPTEQGQQLELTYVESRGSRIAFGSAQVRMQPNSSWDELSRQSTLGERTQPITLELGKVDQIGVYPREPYDIKLLPDGKVIREPAIRAGYDRANASFRSELARRLAESPSREVILSIHGFNETFAGAAFTLAELCHFLSREPVCAFFTWPASHTGNFPLSYTNTTESSSYAVDHLKKTIRLIATHPDVKRVHLLAHSRGSVLALYALRQLFVESVAAGQEPIHSLKVGELVLFSPDVDVDIAAQRVTGYISDPDLISAWPGPHLPRGIHGYLTIYSSPEDRALFVSKILFRSRFRLGQASVEDLPPEGQRFRARLGKVHLISYRGKRTDFFGHSYFTTNPEVSSDVIALLRYRKRIGEPERELVQTGPISWTFLVEQRVAIHLATKPPWPIIRLHRV